MPLKAFFATMSAPMPLHRKVHVVFRNNWVKFSQRQGCGGHPGEPGC